MVQSVFQGTPVTSGINTVPGNVIHDRQSVEREITGAVLTSHMATGCFPERETAGRGHLTGNSLIAGLVVGYTGDYPECMANDPVLQDGQHRVLSWLMERVLSVNGGQPLTLDGKVVHHLENARALRKGCLLLTEHVESFSYNSQFAGLSAIQVSLIALRALGVLFPLNEDDPITLEEIDPDNRVTTCSGHQFSIGYVAYQNAREYRGLDGEGNREGAPRMFLFNPQINSFFSWYDVPSVVIAVLRAEQRRKVERPGSPEIRLNDLHGNYLFSRPSEGSMVVSGWDSLSSFYGWVAALINEGRNDREIYALFDDRVTTAVVPVVQRPPVLPLQVPHFGNIQLAALAALDVPPVGAIEVPPAGAFVGLVAGVFLGLAALQHLGFGNNRRAALPAGPVDAPAGWLRFLRGFIPGQQNN